MIELVIVYIHMVGVSYAFAKSWQKSGVKDAAQSVALIGLVFVIGWSITSPLANLVLPNEWRSRAFSSDTLGLILLLIPEMIFYKLFFIKDEDSAKATVS